MVSGPTATPSGASQAQTFRERARQEADRYGPDPWIFVRELLQNSRDAGASSVAFAVQDTDGEEVVRCRDNGEGMSFHHARQYLFALYASSKETSSNQAGKFGVGFWSILRFDPTQITIRCCTASGERWGLQLEGTLEQATQVSGLDEVGTEITLRRRGGDGRLEHRVFDAVWQSARYLHRRDDPRTPLPITINGRSANAPFALGAPSAAFARGSVRGVVGLGPAPRVELFSRGLRLRAAASLEDLIAPTGRHTSRMRVQFPELPDGLAPQALLESDQLQVLLSRSDARDTRALSRLVKLAQRELERLIEHQLSIARPRNVARRIWDFLSERLRESLALRTLLGSLVGAALALFIAWALWGREAPRPARVATAPAVPSTSVAPPQGVVSRPYQDLGARYRGPRVDVLEPGSAEPIELHYLPAGQRLQFAALTFSRLAADGSPAIDAPLARGGTYRGLSCDRNCVDVELPVSGSGVMRLPVPTGHRLVTDSVRWGTLALDVGSTRGGHPTVDLPPQTGSQQLHYRTVAGPDPKRPQSPKVSKALPVRLRTQARSLRSKMVEDRVDALVELVQARVSYDRTPDVAKQHADAMAAGSGFVARTLDIGAGDCDVQNGLLVALLHAAGVEARLAVGYIGSEGRVFPWLHAWVEYRDASGAWRIADASEGAGTALPSLGVVPAAPTPSVAPSAEAPAPGPFAAAAPPASHAAGAEAPSPGSQSAATPSLDAVPAGAAQRPQSSSRAPASSVRGFDLRWLLWGGIPAVLSLTVLVLFLGRRTRRNINIDGVPDLSRLLRGVLQQPGAFSQLSSLFTRPLIPRIDGGAVSVNRARELAAQGRLYQTAARPALARRAAKARSVVLDAATPEGRTVAESLGAVDLDRWAAWLERTHSAALTDALNRKLHDLGEDWGVGLTAGLPSPVTVLDLGKLGAALPQLPVSRVVLLDPTSPWLLKAARLHRHSPATGALYLVDMLAERLDLSGARREAVLAEVAKDALLEGVKGLPDA